MIGWLKNRIKDVALTTLLLSLLITSCAKQEFNSLLFTQEQQIESYVADFESSLVTVNGGVWRITIEQETGAVVAAEGDSVYFDYIAHLFSFGKGKVFDTSLSQVGEEAGLGHDANYYVPLGIKMGDRSLIEGLNRGLEGVAEGGNYYILFSARHGFGNVQTAIVPKASPLIFEVWIRKVKKS
mgnify:CR=1 FL=1